MRAQYSCMVVTSAEHPDQLLLHDLEPCQWLAELGPLVGVVQAAS